MAGSALAGHDLREGLRRGDGEAYRLLVRTVSEPLYRYVRGLTGDDATACDVVQNVFLNVYKRRSRLLGEGNLSTYCFRIATNLCRNLRRDKALRKLREEEAGEMRRGDTREDDGERRLLAAEAWSGVMQLSEDLREVMLLRFDQGLTLTETASALGLPEGTVSTRQRRGLDELRERFGGRAGLAAPLLALAPRDAAGVADLLGAGTAPIVVPDSLVTSLETAIMATISAKTVSGLAAAILLLMLLAGGGVAGWLAFADGDNAKPRVSTSNLDAHPGQTKPVERPVVLSGNPDNARDTKTTSDSPAPPTSVPTAEHTGTSTTPASTEKLPRTEETIEQHTEVGGRVVDAAGKGVAKAHVGAIHYSDYASTVDNDGMPRGDATCDDEGYFTITVGLTRRIFDESGRDQSGAPIPFRLRASAENFAPSVTPELWAPCQPERGIQGTLLAGIEIPLFGGGAISGVVVDQANGIRPMAAAGVSVTHYSKDPRLDSSRSWEAICDEQGRFEIGNVAVGQYELRPFLRGEGICKYGLPTVSPRNEAVIIATAGERKNVTLRLPRACLLFRVKQPLSKGAAQVSCQVAMDGRNTFVTSISGLDPARDGVYRVPNLTAAVRNVVISAPKDGYLPMSRDIAPKEHTDFDLGTIDLDAGLSIIGKVLNSGGLAAAGARIAATQERDDTSGGDTECTTGEDGAFRLSGFVPGSVTLTVYPRTGGSIRKNVTLPSGGLVEPVVIQLPPTSAAGAIKGSVTVGGREPSLIELGATGWSGYLRVSIVRDSFGGDFNPEDARMYLGGSWLSAAMLLPGSLRPDAKLCIPYPRGNFQVAALAPGRYMVVAGLGQRLVFERGIEVKAGETTEIKLDMGVGGTLEGVITGKDGTPAKGLRVELSHETLTVNASEAETATDAEGRYRFAGLQPGSYFVKLENDGEILGPEQMKQRTVALKEGETARMDISLAKPREGASVRGRVTVGGQSVFKEAAIMKAGDFTSMRGTSVNGEGAFEIGGVKPGSYYLWLADNKMDPKTFVRYVVSVEGSEDAVVERDEPAGKLGGRITWVGAPADYDFTKTKIKLAPALDQPLGPDLAMGFVIAHYRPGSGGNFAIANVPQGSYDLSVIAPGYAPFKERVKIEADTPLNITLGGTAGSLEIVIAAIEGEDKAGAIRETSILSRMAKLDMTDGKGDPVPAGNNDGLFQIYRGGTTRIESLTPGVYSLRIAGYSIELWTGEAIISAGEKKTVNITLVRAATVRLRLVHEELDAGAFAAAQWRVFDAAGKEVYMGRDVFAAFNVDRDATAANTLIITPLVEGRFKIAVTVPGYRTGEIEADVSRSAVLELSLELIKS